MSANTIAADPISRPAFAPLSIALRNLALTFALAVISLVIAGAVWGATGYEMLIVTMGWPHIILGFLFYFGKVLRGEWRARSSFLALALITLALWGAHYAWVITGFIAIYFTYHVFRDEAFIYFQTRSRHRLREAIRVAGFVPFILLMFLATDPRPQHYRHDLRRVEFTGAQLASDGWTAISFEPIVYSGGENFYFYLQQRKGRTSQNYSTMATVGDSRADGEIRISDRQWNQPADLVFQPRYANIADGSPGSQTQGTMPISLTGDFRVGQTFTAQHDNLAGLLIPTSKGDGAGEPGQFVLHLTTDTSLLLPPLSPTLNTVRLALVVILLVIAVWQALPHLRQNRTFWIYFGLFLLTFAVLQKVIEFGSAWGYEVPIMFQLIVVFHYWSWYVFSFDKLRAMPAAAGKPVIVGGTLYDRLLGNLRSLPRFTALVIALNLISVAGVFWYSQLHGPPELRFGFDYSYFLYFLVFHVTFSFGPRQASRRIEANTPAVPAAATA